MAPAARETRSDFSGAAARYVDLERACIRANSGLGFTVGGRNQMRTSFVARILFAALLGLALLFAQSVPQMKTVEPTSAKIGDVLTVAGENLDKANVAEVFLTDGKNDFKASITEQENAMLKIKVPAAVKPGRLALMILTKGKEPKLIEQPVKVTIEE